MIKKLFLISFVLFLLIFQKPSFSQGPLFPAPFPIGITDVDRGNDLANSTNDLAEVAAGGSTCVQSYRFAGIPPWGYTDAEAIRYLDAAQANNLRVMVWLPEEAVQDPVVRANQNLTIISNRVNALKNHPALLLWAIYDEPESTNYGRNFTVLPSNYSNVYNVIKALDPSHPVMGIPASSIDSSYPYLGVDVMLLQYNGVIPEGGFTYPWDLLANYKAAHATSFTTLSDLNMPFLWTSQAYNAAHDPAMGVPPPGAYPTYEQMRYQAYGGITLGAQAVLFVSYKTFDRDNTVLEDISSTSIYGPAQWTAFTNMATEIRNMSPVLLSPTQPPTGITITGPGSTDMMVKQYLGKTYLITVNPSTSAATRQINLAVAQFPSPRITLLPNGTLIPFQLPGRYFDANWGRSEARIYEIEPSTTPDTTPPTVSITAPTGGSTVSGAAVTVSATASDNVAVVGVQFRLDGVNLGIEDTPAPYSVNWDTLTTPNGSHILTAVARDAAGNSTTSAGVSITVNNAFPISIGPTIKANGARSNVTISYPAPVSITVSMNASTYPTDVPVDWWVVASANLSGWYYLNSALQWQEALFSGDLTVFHPVYQGSLVNLSSTAVLSGITLPPGTYDFWFAVDYPMDGILDPNGQILYDQLTVTVQ